jgi:membrane-bound acyltransferase YfiQ involved in biofilm formation
MVTLKIAGWLTLGAAVLHLGIIVGGPDWYRFFGAGENMAVLSEQGSSYPAFTTAIIAGTLFIWSLYAFSGAGVIRLLPFLKTALALIGIIFLLRGLLAVPALYFIDLPYVVELKAKIGFMVTTSIICLILAGLYIKGFLLMYRKSRNPLIDLDNRGRASL